MHGCGATFNDDALEASLRGKLYQRLQIARAVEEVKDVLGAETLYTCPHCPLSATVEDPGEMHRDHQSGAR